MSWKERDGKLTKFFAFKTAEARSEFLLKLSSVESKFNVALDKTKLGPKAVLLKCAGTYMKDHSVSAAINNIYSSIWDSYRGTTKKAEFTKEAISISPLVHLAGKALKSTGSGLRKATRYTGVPQLLAGAARGTKSYLQSAFDATVGHGIYGGGRGNQLESVFTKRPRLSSLIAAGTHGRPDRQLAKDQLGTYYKNLENSLSHNPTYQNILSKVTAGGDNPSVSDLVTRAINTDYVRPHLEALKDLTGQSPLWKRILNGSVIGIRGRSPLRYERNLALKNKDIRLYAALDKRMKDINTNRLIAGGLGTAGLAGGGMATLAANMPEEDTTPEFIRNIANFAGDTVGKFTGPNLGQLLKDNPYLTVGGGSAALLLALYMLMGRNNSGGYPGMYR